jgi:1-acyl-sn-glycerol-3-phosphate acyltransferase
VNLRLRVTGDPWLYAFGRALLVIAVHIYGRVRIFGADNLPETGPAIVIANHPSDVDPILIGVALARTLHFIADVVQFRRGFVGPVISRLGAIPIHNGASDRAALERALALLAAGEVVMIFGEGDLYRRAEPSSFHTGVAFLAARSGAPIVPVGIAGAERIWEDGRVHWAWVRVNVGRPMSFAGVRHNRAAYDRVAEQVREAVIRLQHARPGADTSR